METEINCELIVKEENIGDNEEFICVNEESISVKEKSVQFPCDLCGQKFPDKVAVLEHFKTHTKSTKMPKIKCEKCGKIVPSLSKLGRHKCISWSDNNEPAEVEQDPLEIHERGPKKEHKHKCVCCSKKFEYETDLLKHISKFHSLESMTKKLMNEPEIVYEKVKTLNQGAQNQGAQNQGARSEEHTLNSSHITISYTVFCLKKKNYSFFFFFFFFTL